MFQVFTRFDELTRKVIVFNYLGSLYLPNEERVEKKVEARTTSIWNDSNFRKYIEDTLQEYYLMKMTMGYIPYDLKMLTPFWMPVEDCEYVLPPIEFCIDDYYYTEKQIVDGINQRLIRNGTKVYTNLYQFLGDYSSNAKIFLSEYVERKEVAYIASDDPVELSKDELTDNRFHGENMIIEKRVISYPKKEVHEDLQKERVPGYLIDVYEVSFGGEVSNFVSSSPHYCELFYYDTQIYSGYIGSIRPDMRFTRMEFDNDDTVSASYDIYPSSELYDLFRDKVDSLVEAIYENSVDYKCIELHDKKYITATYDNYDDTSTTIKVIINPRRGYLTSYVCDAENRLTMSEIKDRSEFYYVSPFTPNREMGITDMIGFWLASLPLETHISYNYYHSYHSYHSEESDLSEEEEEDAYNKGVFYMTAHTLHEYYENYDTMTPEEQDAIYLSEDRTEEYLTKAWRLAYDNMSFKSQKGY